MKAAIFYGEKDIKVENRTLKNVGDEDVKIKVAWSGICGSELHDYIHGPKNFLAADKINPNTQRESPLNMGHEFSGEVAEIGRAVNGIKVGDRVTVNPMLLTPLDSPASHAQYTVMPADSVYILPDEISIEKGALIEPTATAVQAVKNGNVTIGSKVVVIGAGPIGLLTMLSLKAVGATTIIAVDLSENRLKTAKEIGATHVINPAEQDTVEAVKKIIPGGADFTFEVAGVEVAFKQAIQTTKQGGKLVMVSVFTKEINWNPFDLLVSGVTIIPSLAYTPETFQETIDLIASGQLEAEKVITDRIGLEEIVPKGFEALINDKFQAKILIDLNK